MKKMPLAALALGICVAGATLADGSQTHALAQSRATVKAASSQYSVSQQMLHRAGFTVIYSNFAVLYPKGVYYASVSAQYLSPAEIIAVQFTPTANVSATEIDAAITFQNGNDAPLTLAIYSDKKGKPSKSIVSGTASGLGEFGDCCNVAMAPIAATPLVAGTPYWVVALASGSTNNPEQWMFNTFDQVNKQTVDTSLDGGKTWFSPQLYLPGLAFQVLGQ